MNSRLNFFAYARFSTAVDDSSKLGFKLQINNTLERGSVFMFFSLTDQQEIDESYAQNLLLGRYSTITYGEYRLKSVHG